MRDTFFEKWLEEKIEKDPETGRRIFSGDSSEKTKSVQADINKREQEKAAKRKAKKNKPKSELEKRIENSPAMKNLGKGKEVDVNNPAPNTQPVEKPKKSVTKRESQTDRALDIKQQEADRKDRAQAAKEKAYADKRADKSAKEARSAEEKARTAEAAKKRQAAAETKKKQTTAKLAADNKKREQKKLLDNRKTRTAKIGKLERTKAGDDSLKAGGVVASNLVKTARKLSSSSGLTDAGDKLKAKVTSPIKKGAGAVVNKAKSAVKKGVGYVAQRIKQVRQERQANLKKRRSIVKRDPNATAVTQNKGGALTRSPGGSLAKGGGGSSSALARRPGIVKSGSSTSQQSTTSQGQQARSNPQLKRRLIAKDVAAARSTVQRRKASNTLQSHLSKAKGVGGTLAKRASNAGGSMVRSVSQTAKKVGSGLATQAKKTATGIRQRGAADRQKFNKSQRIADRLIRMQNKGLKPGAGKRKISEGVSTSIESWKKKQRKKKRKNKKGLEVTRRGDDSLKAGGVVASNLVRTIGKLAKSARKKSNWREEFLHEIGEPQMGETDQIEPKSKSKSKKEDDDKQIDVMKGKNKVEVNPKLAAESINHPIDPQKHRENVRKRKIEDRAKSGQEGSDIAQNKLKPTQKTDLPKFIKKPDSKKKLDTGIRRERQGAKKSKYQEWLDRQLQSEDNILEVAPPGREKQVKALKKKFPNDPEAPYKIAWAQHNKESVMIQDANGNDFLEVIDVIKAEPLVPVKEGHSEYDKFDKERKKADNLKGAKKVAQLMKAAKIRKGVKGPKATKVFGGQEYHDDKVDKVVESKKSKMVSIVKAVSNEKKRKNALQIQKYIGEEEINEISMDTVQSAFDKAGKKADEARDKGDRWEASRRDRQRANIAGMAAGRRRRLDKKKSTLEKIFKSS